MSRARIMCSEILSRMSPINQYDEKVFNNINSSNEKIFNLCEYSNGEVFVENVDVSNVLSEMNTSVDDWFRQKPPCTSMDCMDTGYLNDENFLSTKDPDMCSSDIGLELVLVNDNEKKEHNLNFCSISEKNVDLDCNDPMLNLVPMNEVLLRKTETKCDNLSGKDLYSSDGDMNLQKSRFLWDTLSIASRKSDCDVENNGDFSDFNNLLSFNFDTNEHISSLEPISENIIKTHPTNNNKSVLNDKIDISLDTNLEFSKTSTSTASSSLFTDSNKKIGNIKRPNIIRSNKNKSDSKETKVSKNSRSKNKEKNINVKLLNSVESDDSVFNFSNDSKFTAFPKELNNPVKTVTSKSTINNSINAAISNLQNDKRTLKKHNILELNNMTGAVAIVSNLRINSKSKTKIVIKTKKGEERYEGSTAELTEIVGTNRKNRKSNTPIEGQHIVTSVKTAASIKKERNTNSSKIVPEPENRLVKEMLGVLGITDEMLYTILTNLRLRMWICPEIECTRIFNRLNTLKSHILTHYGLKPFKCDFPDCTWSFYTSFKLKRHRETHLKRKDFVCTVPDCNRTFTTIYNLNTHLKLHERPARLKCLVRTCNFKFQTRRAMEMHLKTHEISLAPYKCTHPGCNKLYFSCSALMAHSRCHQHKEEELRCQWEKCGRLFDKPCRLKAHMRQHTGDKPYVCKYKDCKWAFASSSKLKRHQYKHNNERKFRCTIGDCNKAFMRSEHLREHTFTHIAQRSFQCTICGEKCSAKATLYVHKKKFHPNETSSKSNKKSPEVPSTIENKTELLTLTDNLANTEVKESENAAFFITLLDSYKPNDVPNVNTRQVLIQDVDGKEYEVNVTIPSNSSLLSKPVKKQKTNFSNSNSCARTYLPYSANLSKKPTVEAINDEQLVALDEQLPNAISEDQLTGSDETRTSALASEVVLDNPVTTETMIESTMTNITLPSDFLLGSDILQNNQDTVYLSNFMLQEDVETMDIYNGEEVNGAEYILLLNSATNTQSTINLKDLD